jgi:hypothetical protein
LAAELPGMGPSCCAWVRPTEDRKFNGTLKSIAGGAAEVN